MWPKYLVRGVKQPFLSIQLFNYIKKTKTGIFFAIQSVTLPKHPESEKNYIMKICRHTFLMLIALLMAGGAMAQSARMKAANKQFDNMSYLNAVRAYEDFLRLDKKEDAMETREALIRLGYS